MRGNPFDVLLGLLEGKYPEGALGFMTPQEALAELRERTGVDFGMDVHRWQAWGIEHRQSERGGPIEDRPEDWDMYR